MKVFYLNWVNSYLNRQKFPESKNPVQFFVKFS